MRVDALVVDQSGKPIKGALVWINTFKPSDFGVALTVNPNPRATGADGIVNFYNDSENRTIPPLVIQMTAEAGGYSPQTVVANDPPFDGTADLQVTVRLASFRRLTTTGPVVRGRLRRQGASLVSDGGPFQWRGVSAFRLAHMASAAEDIAPSLDWCVANGITVIRVLTMCRNMFALEPPRGREGVATVLDESARRGLYVEVVALADTFAYPGLDVADHVRLVGQICADHENALLEVCNEPGQQWQRFTPEQLVRFAAPVPSTVPISLGAPDGPADESRELIKPITAYHTVHGDRTKAPWGVVRHTREQQVTSDQYKLFVVNDEPEKILTLPQHFGMGALCRVCALGDTFHAEWGKMCRLPTADEQAAFDARRRGWASVPVEWHGRFTNFGWRPPLPESPVDGFKALSDDARAYGSVDDSTAYVALTHATNPTFRPGWRGERIDGFDETSVWKVMK